MTQCGLILLVGQFLTVIKAKWILLAAIFFFELGSLICAVAQNMPVLIFGRAVQGIGESRAPFISPTPADRPGASGMFVSILAVIAIVIRLEQRAAFMSAFGLVLPTCQARGRADPVVSCLSSRAWSARSSAGSSPSGCRGDGVSGSTCPSEGTSRGPTRLNCFQASC